MELKGQGETCCDGGKPIVLREILWDQNFVKAINDNPFFDPTDGEEGEDDRGPRHSGATDTELLKQYMSGFSDLTRCRPEPGSQLVEKLELECTKNMHDGDLVYYGQARTF